MKTLFFFFFLFLITTLSYSQEVVIVEDSISGGVLITEMVPELDNLLEEKESYCDKAVTKTTGGKVDRKPVSTTDLCAQYPKLSGWKIQILSTKTQSEAIKIRNEFMASFPGLSSAVDYRRPDFKIKVGDYFYRTSAASDLAKIKKKYPAALLIQSTIYCRKAK